MKDLESTINKMDCDAIVVATPVDLGKLIELKKPSIRIRYELQEIDKPTLEDVFKFEVIHSRQEGRGNGFIQCNNL
jgi:predicted GTPase